jgi:hypothetical protein
MKAIYLFAAAFVAFFVMLLTFTWLSEVSDADVYAYHEADFDTDLKLVSPGAIVALSRSGEITRICSLKQGKPDSDERPAMQVRTSLPPTGLYYNKLAENLPVFVGVVENIKSTFGIPVAADPVAAADIPAVTGASFVPRVARVFKGQPVGLERLVDHDQFDEPDCEKQIASHISRGYRACTVLRVLNQVELDADGRAILDDETGTIMLRTVAITLAEDANFVKESAFARYDLDYNDNAREANGVKCKGSSLPWSARFRKALEVIGRIEA